MQSRLQPLAFALVTSLLLACLPGCGAQQRAAEKLIDPQLRSQGVLLEHNAGRSRRGDLDLGGYRVSGFDLRDEDVDGSGPLAPEDGRTRPTQQMRLRFDLITPERALWRSECVGWRRQPADHDLAAAADEARDEIALRCELEGPAGSASAGASPSEVEREDSPRWTLSLDGTLGVNLLGRLQAQGDPEAVKVVEVILWYQLLNLTMRRMPAALALIRSGEPGGSEAALILDSPERAWVARDLDERGRALAMITLLSLRLLPLGFES